MATKKNTKKVNVDLVVDLTNCSDASDVYYAFAKAKVDKHLSKIEKEVFKEHNTQYVYMFVEKHCDCECCNKKPNIFKRFWNWLTK